MQITTEDYGNHLELRVDGRLDNEWSDHLNEAIDKAIRLGSHAVVLDLTDVSYISSAGIGVLVKAHKQFQGIRGFFGVGMASPYVAEVIKMTGLAKMLLCDLESIRKNGNNASATMHPTFRLNAETGMAFEQYEINPKAEVICEVLGHADQFPNQTLTEQNCRSLDFPSTTFGLGLGAFGSDFADSANRFGEFIAVSGTAACLPTSNARKPDYQVTKGDFIPHVQVAYGLRCVGEFRQLHRFEPLEDDSRISLSALVDQCLTLCETDAAGFIIVAETSGLIGTSLRRSPALKTETATSKMSHPEIRQWLSFSPDKLYQGSLAIVVGIATRGDPTRSPAAEMAPLLRPMRFQTDRSASRPASNVENNGNPAAKFGDIQGHFHAAVFSYRPFKKRKLDLAATIDALFESEDLQSVMHLLNDDREISGGGESEFVRGACWIAPISGVKGGEPR